MATKARKATLSVLLAGAAAVLVAPPAEANRGTGGSTTTTTQPGYVPPYGQPTDLPDEENPYANPEVAPTVVSVDLPAVVDPGLGDAGDGNPLAPAPTTDNALPESGTRPDVQAPPDERFGGILSRTGAESLPMARAGVAALALGIGLVVLTRRRRSETVPA